jgi:peptide/nickel transport system substrate-binding protein
MFARLARFVSLLLALSFVLSACGPVTPAAQPPATIPPAATEAPAETEPTAVPTTRRGGWMDTIVYTSIDTIPDAVAQLKADAVDAYAYGGVERDAFEATQGDPQLAYSIAYGNSVRAFMFNPAGPTFQDGRLNPFSNPKIREACNWLIDRKYVAEESIGPLGAPQTVVLIGAMPDYVRYADIIRPLEAKYSYDFDKAKSTITSEMETMGATMGSDGKWQFNGKAVALIGLIRSEDDRTMMGNYFADQLEKIGFTVDRQVRTRNELSPIWGQSDPTLGEWHFYTGGWGYNAILRNAGLVFDWYYNPRGGSTTTEQAYTPSPEFDKVSLDLTNNNYKTMDERRELFSKALELSLKESQVVWVDMSNRFYPSRSNVQIATDLMAGMDLAQMGPYTLRFKGEEGGTMRIATSGILTGAWNPVSMQNWVQEVLITKATTDDAVLADPYTGLNQAQRLERAEVVAKDGLPMVKTLDWVDLSFEPEIAVPAEAWADWDAKAQKWITVGEKYPDGTTALTKITVHYPADMWQTVKWHDGSSLSMGDFIVNMIQRFDRAKPDSPIYDEAAVPLYDSMMTVLKGFQIVSTDPLVIETYADTFDIDAETLIGQNRWATWYPTESFIGISPVSWHAYTIGMLAEQNRELGFSQEKSTALNVTWTHYVDGPSLEILKKYLDQAGAETFIPYAPTAGQYITAEEAAARYSNLSKWYATHDHFWIGTGPYYLDQVNSVEQSLVVKNYPDYADLANKWERFGEPKIPVVDASGPSKVTVGGDASFDVLVSFNDAPYAADDLESILFLLYNSEGSMIGKGQAEYVAEGQYVINLTPELTAQLKEGASQMEIIGISKLVAIPVFTTVNFIAAP